MKNRVLVELCDKQYTITTNEPEMYVKHLAIEVNKLINDTIYRNIRYSKIDATLLICLDLYDKKAKLAETNDNMRKEITTYVDEIEKLKKKLSKYEQLLSEKAERPEAVIDSIDKNAKDAKNIEDIVAENKLNKEDNEDKAISEDNGIIGGSEEIKTIYPSRPAHSAPPVKERDSKAESGKNSASNINKNEGTKSRTSEQHLASVESLKERWRKIEHK